MNDSQKPEFLTQQAKASVSVCLDEGLQALGLDGAIAVPLLAYLDELVKWNRAYNLTAVRDPRQMVTRHLLDALAVLPALDARLPESARLIDVGAGAGIPGLVLAVARPGWQVTVLDSNGKKARFLRHAQRTLGLANVAVIEARAEAVKPDSPFDAVISRAFAALADFLRWTGPLAAEDGVWLAMKGKLEDSELSAVPRGFAVRDILPLSVPGLSEARHLVVLQRAGAGQP